MAGREWLRCVWFQCSDTGISGIVPQPTNVPVLSQSATAGAYIHQEHHSYCSRFSILLLNSIKGMIPQFLPHLVLQMCLLIRLGLETHPCMCLMVTRTLSCGALSHCLTSLDQTTVHSMLSGRTVLMLLTPVTTLDHKLKQETNSIALYCCPESLLQTLVCMSAVHTSLGVPLKQPTAFHWK